jgi:hypothetical protein
MSGAIKVAHARLSVPPFFFFFGFGTGDGGDGLGVIVEYFKAIRLSLGAATGGYPQHSSSADKPTLASRADKT